MDILSHGLWPVIVAKKAENKFGKKLNKLEVFLWGIFPDLFAFTLPFLWMFWSVIIGDRELFSDFPHPERGGPIDMSESVPLAIAYNLYNYSHSLPVFFVVIVLLYFLRGRKLYREILAWPLHIIMDIPTHSFDFFPTPFLWPISEFKIDGFGWGTSWFIILNYSVIFLLLFLLRKPKNINLKPVYTEDKTREIP